MLSAMTRRAFLRAAAGTVSLTVLAACQPKVVEKIVKETVVVKEVVTQEKIVKEAVEVEKEVTRVVEKEVPVQKAEDKPATVTYWGYATGARFVPGRPWGQASGEDFFQWQKETFEELHPNVKVQVEMLLHDRTYFTKIDAALMAGTQPDIVMGPISEAARYITRGLCSNLDEYVSETDWEDFSPAIKKEMNFEGKHYLWPWRLSFGGGVCANGKILEERGVKDLLPQDEERKDWTPDDFLQIAKQCTFDRNGDGKIDVYGTAVCGLSSYVVMQILYGFGAEVWNADESAVIINSPEGIAATEWVDALEWVHKVAVPGTASFALGDTPPMYLAGQTAIYPHSGAGGKTADIEAAEANGTLEFIWLMPPSLPDKDPGVMTNMHGYYVMKGKDLDQTWWAHKFCEHMVRPEAIALSVASGLPPARTSFWGQVGNDPNMSVGVRMVNYMRSFGRRQVSNQIVMTDLPKYFSAVFSHQMSAKEALDKFAAESTKLLQDEMAKK